MRSPTRYRLAWLWEEDPDKGRAAWMVNPHEPPDEFGRPTYYPTPTPIPAHPRRPAPASLEAPDPLEVQPPSRRQVGEGFEDVARGLE